MRVEQERPTARFSTRELVYIAIFGAAWGLVETSLGSYLHAARIPFRGAVLTAVGLGLALCGRSMVPRRGAVLMIGLVTAILRLLSIGGVVLSPVLGILVESLLAELVLWPLARPSRGAFALAGAVATFWTVLHPFVTQGLLAGSGVVTVYRWLLEGTARVVPFWTGVVGVVLAITIVVPLALGCVAGVVAHALGSQLRARLSH